MTAEPALSGWRRTSAAGVGGLWDDIRSRSPITWGELQARLATETASQDILICFLRHGETVTNALHLITGSLDVSLTDRGRLEAIEAARMLVEHDFDIAWSSTLRRCIETRDIALEAAGVNGVVARLLDERLNERSLGDLQGRRQRFIPELAAGDLFYAPRGGESYAAVTARCLSFLLDLRELQTRLSRPLHLLVTTHMGPLRILLGIIAGATDSTTVLAQQFDNSSPICARMRHLEWPAFLPSAEELGKPQDFGAGTPGS